MKDFQHIKDITLKKKRVGTKGPGHGFGPGEYWNVYLDNRKEPVGFIGFKEDKEGLKWTRIYIEPAYRGKGIAMDAIDLLAEMLHIDVLLTTVNTNNKSSHKAHKKAGWQVVDTGYIKHYYW